MLFDMLIGTSIIAENLNDVLFIVNNEILFQRIINNEFAIQRVLKEYLKYIPHL